MYNFIMREGSNRKDGETFFEKYIKRPKGVSKEMAGEPEDFEQLNHAEMDSLSLFLRANVPYMRAKTARLLSDECSEPEAPEFSEWPALQEDVTFLLSLKAPPEILSFGIQRLYEQYAAGNYCVVASRRPAPWNTRDDRMEFERKVTESYDLRYEWANKDGALDVLLKYIVGIMLSFRSGEWQAGRAVV